jgi:transcriptional regulator with XRE-family HTH domain
MENFNVLSLAKKVRKIREFKGFSQENIAHDLGLSTSHYAKLERGEVRFSLEHLGKLADLYNLQIESFFTCDEQQIINQSNNMNPVAVNSGTLITNPIEKIQELYEAIIKSKNEEIERLLTILKKNNLA